MKKLSVILLLVAFAIFAVGDTIHDFRANDLIDYFSRQPLRLLLVATIAIAGGLIVFVFFRLSPRWQHRITLIALASAAIGCTAILCWLLYTCVQISRIAGKPTFRISDMAWPVIAAVLLWFFFYRALKKRAA